MYEFDCVASAHLQLVLFFQFCVDYKLPRQILLSIDWAIPRVILDVNLLKQLRATVLRTDCERVGIDPQAQLR